MDGLFIPVSVNYDYVDKLAMMPKNKMEAEELNERWASVNQVAQHLNVKPDTVYKWLERKDMPAHKVGRLWRFKYTEIDAWVKSGDAAEKVQSKPRGKRSGSRR